MIGAIEQQAEVDALISRVPAKMQEYAQVFPAERCLSRDRSR